MLETVLLVIVLCEREAGIWNNLRKHCAPESRGDLPLRLLCQTLLLLVVIKNYGSILPGPGAVGRIMALPEHVQQLSISYPFRVIVDLDRFRMVAQIMVCRIFLRSAGIPYTCTDDAPQTPELGVRSPESA